MECCSGNWRSRASISSPESVHHCLPGLQIRSKQICSDQAACIVPVLLTILAIACYTQERLGSFILKNCSVLMKKSIPLALLTLIVVITPGFGTTWTITNSGFHFTPDTLWIVVGDDVDFSLESSHDVLEVSQETWDANGTIPLESGFALDFGGGFVSMDKLEVGTHWYICPEHAETGMKGVIIVESATALPENRSEDHISFYPNPVFDILTIESNQDFLGSSFSFSDLTGKLILTGKINEEFASIDVSSFKSGIYFLQVGERRKRTYKVIKQ